MTSVSIRSVVAASLVVLAVMLVGMQRGVCQSAVPPGTASAGQSDYRADFETRLKLLGDWPPDPCGPPSARGIEPPEDNESRLFEDAAHLIVEGLNAAGTGTADSARETAATVLQDLQATSARVNGTWPEQNRFHYRIQRFGPVLVVQLSVRTYDAFRALAPTGPDGSARLWRQIGSDAKTVSQRFSGTTLEVHPLYSPSARRIRFLTRLLISACAGSVAIEYVGWEWDSDACGDLDQVISQSGSLGLDDRVPGFEQMGEMQFVGRGVALPYCWFSGIDTWDNPSLCALDTYDLSGPEVRFQSRQVNRPDLLPVANAIEYAQKHEYESVRAYCGSDAVAHELVRELPPFVSAGAELKVTHTGRHSERVELGDDPGYRFDVAERAGQWVVVGFKAPPEA